MTKNELLDLAGRQRNLPRAALKFAKKGLSDSDIEKRRMPAVTAEKWFDAGCRVGGWSLFGIGALATTLTLYPTVESGRPVGDWLISAFFGSLAGAMVTLVCLLVACLLRHAAGWEKPLKLLVPVAGTDYCEVGLSLLEQGGPLTAAWRDLALKERSQLYVFDLEIMGALGRINQVRAEKAERQAKLDEACRKLHDVPGPA
jgi:hypothetical protein